MNDTSMRKWNWPLAGITKVVVFLIALIGFAISALPVLADTPLKQLESNIAELTTILDDKEYRETHTKDDLKKKLIETAEDRFGLFRHWSFGRCGP